MKKALSILAALLLLCRAHAGALTESDVLFRAAFLRYAGMVGAAPMEQVLSELEDDGILCQRVNDRHVYEIKNNEAAVLMIFDSAEAEGETIWYLKDISFERDRIFMQAIAFAWQGEPRYTLLDEGVEEYPEGPARFRTYYEKVYGVSF